MSESKGSGFRVDEVVLREIRMPFRSYFETSFGRSYDKEAILVQVCGEGLSGWGECVAGEGPFYSYEDCTTAWHVLSRFLVPLLDVPRTSPESYRISTRSIRGHPMARAALETALWDLLARLQDLPLWRLLGGVRNRIPCGVSIGIQDSVPCLLEKIRLELEAGYQRIKLKIRPGWDLEVLEQVRRQFGAVPLMADANAAYDLGDAALFAALDEFDLMMIEQPLHHEDLLDHCRLQKQIETPVCLDESIRHEGDAALAVELGACRIINIKLGRMGGIQEARAVHDLALRNGVPVWCGGMLETGIGRAHNVALSTLENFCLPGDVSGSRRYFDRDTVDPPVVAEGGFIEASEEPGIGYHPDLPFIEQITVKKETFRLNQH